MLKIIKKTILIAVIMMVLLSVQALSAENNDTFVLEDDGSDLTIYVDNQKGSDLNTGSINSPVESIAHAVDAAVNNSDIHLSGNTYSGDKNTRITIDKSLNFIGEDTVIDGEGENYIFTITGDVNVTFKNIRFINAYKSPESYAINYPDSVYGSCLEIKNGKVIVDNCIFQSNVVDYSNNNRYTYGGAVSNSGSLTITDSKFISNIAHSTSGLYSYGGSIYNNGDLVINGSEFLKSDCDDFSYGGVIANDGDMIIDNTLIANCKVSQESRGGVIHNTGNFRLTGSIIENNTVSKSNFQYVYGAVYNSGSFTALSNIFKNNTAIYSTPSRGSPTIYSSGRLNLTYNLFIANEPYDGVYKDVYITSGDVISLDNNWWGSNDDPYSTNAVNIDDEINTWLILDISPEYSPLNIAGKVDITVKWSLNMPVDFNSTLIPQSVIEIKSNTYDFNDEVVYTFSDTYVKGLYQIPVIFGDFSKIVEADVGKIKTFITLTANDNLTYMEDFNITVSVLGEDNLSPDGIVLISIDDNIYSIALENGYGNYQIHGLYPGTYELEVSFNGSSNYFKSFHTSNVTVNKKDIYMNMSIPEFFIDESYYIDVNLGPEGSKSSAVIYIDGVRKKIVYLYDDRENRISLSGFGEGEYNITVSYVENTYFKSSNVTGILKIRKYSSNINVTVSDIMVGETQTIRITADPGDLRGEAILNINSNSYAIFINDTVTDITVSNLKAGVYEVGVVFEGDAKYSQSAANASFKVSRYASNFEVTVEYDENTLKGNVYVKTGSRNCTGEVSVMINYMIYTSNLSSGEASFQVSYDKGTNYIYVYWQGDDYWDEAKWNTTVGTDSDFILMSEDLKSYEYNDFNYSFRLIEPSGVPLPSRTVTVEFENNCYTVTTDDDGYGYLKLNLKEGNYTVKSSYNNQTVTNNIEIVKITFKLISINATYPDPVIFTADFEDNLNGLVNFTVDNVLSGVAEIVNGSAVFNASYINAGVYTLNAYYFNDYFNSSPNSVEFKVDKGDSVFNLTVDNVISGEDANITLTLSENTSGKVIFILDGNRYVIEIKDNKAVLSVLNISGANHTLNITYEGDINYNPNSLNTSFYIKDLRSKITLTLSDITYGETLNITADLDTDVSGNVTFSLGNITKTVNITDSRASLCLDSIDAGNYTVTAVYNGNTYYVSSADSGNFSVFRANSTIRLEANAGMGENILIYAYLSSNASGYVSFSMPGYYTSRNKAVDDAIALWYISPLDTGEYTVKASYLGDRNYYPSNTTYLINITQKKTTLQVEIRDVKVGERISINVRLTARDENLTDKVTVKLNSREYTVNVVNGKGSLVLGSFPIGTYSYEAIYAGNENYTSETLSGSFDVAEILEVNLQADNITKYYGGSEKLEVELTDSGNNPLNGQVIDITLNSKTYHITTDSEGKISLDLNLKSGNYTALVNFDGGDKYRSRELNVSIEVKATVSGIDVVKLYGSAVQYFAFFLSSNGDALANTEVTFKIAGKSYTANTLPNGITRLNINFNPGDYVIQAVNPVTGEIASNKIRIYNLVMNNKDLTQNYGENKYYKVRIYTDSGKVAGAGVKVKFKVSGKTYTRTTDSSGYAKIRITQKPGTYTIYSSYGGVSVKNKITVKSIVKIRFQNTKKSSKIFKIRVSLKKVNGKYLMAKKITLKIKSKKFTVKTSKKGVAVFKIKKSMFKKSKKYTYTVTYKKDSVKRYLRVK